jgi:hypothetical protein
VERFSAAREVVGGDEVVGMPNELSEPLSFRAWPSHMAICGQRTSRATSKFIDLDLAA